MNDQRKNDKGAEGRKPFLQRYAGFFGTLLMISFLVIVSLVGTWHKSVSAFDKAEANEGKLTKHSEINKQIPVLQESIKRIDESLKDFRTEQRIFNRELIKEIRDMRS